MIKTLQMSTRCLQHYCAHSKAAKDTNLVNHVPQLKKTLETMLFKVKVGNHVSIYQFCQNVVCVCVCVCVCVILVISLVFHLLKYIQPCSSFVISISTSLPRIISLLNYNQYVAGMEHRLLVIILLYVGNS